VYDLILYLARQRLEVRGWLFVHNGLTSLP